MKDFFLNTAFNIGKSPSDRAERFAINFGLYVFLLIAIGLGFANHAQEEPALMDYPIFIPLVGVGFLVLHILMAMAFHSEPNTYLDRILQLSRNGVIFPALALPFVFTMPYNDVLPGILGGLLFFTYVYVWLGHIFILAQTKTHFIWYLVFTVNRFIAMVGGGYIVFGLN